MRNPSSRPAETDNDADTTAVKREGGPYKQEAYQPSRAAHLPCRTPYYALNRNTGTTWYQGTWVEGNGNRNTHTDYPQNYPESKGPA